MKRRLSRTRSNEISVVRGLQVPSDFRLSRRTKLIYSNLNPSSVSIYLQQSWMYTNVQPQARIKFFVIKIEKLDHVPFGQILPSDGQ